MAYTLKLRHQVYFVRVRLTEAEKRAWGSSEIVKTTGQRDKRAAVRIAESEVVPRVRREIAEAIAAKSRPTRSKDDPEQLVELGSRLRQFQRKGEITVEQADEELAMAAEQMADRRSDLDPETGYPIDADGRFDRALTKAQKLVGDPDYRPLSEWIAIYFKNTTKLSESTRKLSKTALDLFVEWAGADADIRDLTRKTAASYVAEKINAMERAYETKLTYVSRVSAFITEVCDLAGMESNPFDGAARKIARGREERRSTRRAWRQEELVKLLSVPFPRPDLSAAVLLALYTGARIEEICSTRIEAVNLSEETSAINPMPNSLRPPEEKAKNQNSVRSIPIHLVVAPLVRKLVDTSSDGFLISGLTSPGASRKRSHFLSVDFGKWCDKIGLADRGLTFHSLRHTMTTALESVGVPLSTAQLIVGHSRQSITYGHYSKGSWELIESGITQLTFGPADALAIKLVAAHVGNPKAGEYRRRTLGRRSGSK